MLDAFHEYLGWPAPNQILTPPGHGPRVYARIIEEKIGSALRRRPDGHGVQVGVLTENPWSETTEPPIAIVCEFPKTVSIGTLREAHRLAWNFNRARLLITLEPLCVRIWTCWNKPTDPEELLPGDELLNEISFNKTNPHTNIEKIANTLHWAKLATGFFFTKYPNKFRQEQRADQLLLSNLKCVRKRLKKIIKEDDVIHDLLARLIFIQFLFQRTDKNGQAALRAGVLQQLCKDKILSKEYSLFETILSSKDDTYNLFKWLNNKFNGDLFPGKGKTEEEREREWRTEMEFVSEPALSLLADFVSGRLKMDDGQLCLWPMYSFDTIPLEFISSIYEEFVSKSPGSKGAHYTPDYIVDFMLDSVLPWGDKEWDLKILDPACGSGVFLVKCFQRLIFRWRYAHEDTHPDVTVLRRFLEKNIFGIDINPHAVRVASFSLYLMMCDHLDPLEYWTSAFFPRLRGQTLIVADFFADVDHNLHLINDNEKFDLVIGNAPWGENVITKEAQEWAEEHKWPLPNKEIGTLFIPKAASLGKKGSHIAMLQPAGPTLFNQSKPARKYREKLFTNFNIQEVVNFAALRFGLFSKSISPSCAVILTIEPPNDEPTVYCCPRPSYSIEDDYKLTIDQYCINYVNRREALQNDPSPWVVLMWGSRRDLYVLRYLCSGRSETVGQLSELRERPQWIGCEGYKRGNRQMEKMNLADGSYMVIKSENIRPFRIEGRLLPNTDPHFDSGHFVNDHVFEGPLLLFSKSWTVGDDFKAAIYPERAIFPASSMYGFHFPQVDRQLAQATCIIANSSLATWFLGLTSGRASFYIPEVLTSDLLKLPIGTTDRIESCLERTSIEGVRSKTAINEFARKWVDIKESEWVLIDDYCKYVVKGFRQPHLRIGKAKPNREDLRTYCELFLDVLSEGFGCDKSIGATVYESDKSGSVGLRLLAFQLDAYNDDQAKIIFKKLSAVNFLSQLLDIHNKCTERSKATGGIFYQRIVKFYDVINIDSLTVPVVYIVKPDEIRYWTRTVALRDADDVSTEILAWADEDTRNSEEMNA